MPRRKWGQHFLRDPATARRLVAAAGVQPGETVLEIGPGTGRLTRALLEACARVLAVEVDPKLAAELPGRMEVAEDRLQVVQADAAQEDMTAVLRRHVPSGEPVRAVGNLPYESATAILSRLLEARARLNGIAILVQKEVADRLVSPPGTRAYGYLSVICQDVAEPRVVQRLRPGAFRPPPKVQSALVRLELREAPLRGAIHGPDFRRLVAGLFGQRRKTILNNLQAATGLDRAAAEQALARGGLDPRLRPEDLSVAQLADLFRNLPDTAG
jgi:16S rRNA (adenine1518-N6/adenine1519-N6)-dimethyltransferase